MSQRVNQPMKQRRDEPSVWKDPFRGRPELHDWLALDYIDFDKQKNDNSSRAYDGNGSQGERNLFRPERTCITAIGNPFLIEDTSHDSLSRHRVKERHGFLDSSIEGTLSNETRRIDQQTLQPANGPPKLDKTSQSVTYDENESKSRYEESKADTDQDHATKDGVESGDTNVRDELGKIATIYDRCGSIKRKISSSSSQGQGESDHVLGRICQTVAGDAVTLNVHDGYNSDSNSKDRCKSNVHDKCDLQLYNLHLIITDTYNVNSDKERPRLLTQRCKLGHHRHHEDQDYKSRETDPLLDQAEACGQGELLGP